MRSWRLIAREHAFTTRRFRAVSQPIARLAVVVLLVMLAGSMAPVGHAESAVNTLTGVYSYDRVDASGIVDGVVVPFRRTYNSNDTRVTPMGQGWTHNFAVHLARPAEGSQDMVLVGPQGRSDIYTWNPDGSGNYRPRPDLPVLALKLDRVFEDAAQADEHLAPPNVFLQELNYVCASGDVFGPRISAACLSAELQGSSQIARPLQDERVHGSKSSSEELAPPA